MTEDVLFECRGGIGLITLNRPKALNTLNLAMYRAIEPWIDRWAADPSIHAIVIRGAGGKAFCAGGDVRALWESGCGVTGADDPKRVFFYEEYRIIAKIHRLPKPYIALMNGITMGGGVGMSVNGSHPVATDNTVFAMPETAIGLFPDVGATRFLARCPGAIGRYLGLTGMRLKAADLLYTGLARHYVPYDRLDAVIDALAELSWQDGQAFAQVDQLLTAMSGDPGAPPLAALRAGIERCFAPSGVDAILAALAAEPGEWAQELLAKLTLMSPTSLKITERQLSGPSDISLEAALMTEFVIGQHVMALPDFFEGVRAVLVDRDQQPRWSPSVLSDVPETLIDSVFAPLTDGALHLDYRS